jgi:hypothetical protein
MISMRDALSEAEFTGAFRVAAKLAERLQRVKSERCREVSAKVGNGHWTGEHSAFNDRGKSSPVQVAVLTGCFLPPPGSGLGLEMT